VHFSAHDTHLRTTPARLTRTCLDISWDLLISMATLTCTSLRMSLSRVLTWHTLAHQTCASHSHLSWHLLRSITWHLWYLSQVRVDRKNPPPPGGFPVTMFLNKNPKEEDPTRSTWCKFFEGGCLSLGSCIGNIVNRKPPRRGGFPLPPRRGGFPHY